VRKQDGPPGRDEIPRHFAMTSFYQPRSWDLSTVPKGENAGCRVLVAPCVQPSTLLSSRPCGNYRTSRPTLSAGRLCTRVHNHLQFVFGS
jgi:hypothetical protein